MPLGRCERFTFHANPLATNMTLSLSLARDIVQLFRHILADAFQRTAAVALQSYRLVVNLYAGQALVASPGAWVGQELWLLELPFYLAHRAHFLWPGDRPVHLPQRAIRVLLPMVNNIDPLAVINFDSP